MTTCPTSGLSTSCATLGLAAGCATLPDGLDTLLGSGGGGLSAGEAQLLAFARVFLRDPGLVILDEASSRLDPATERLVERASTGCWLGAPGSSSRTGWRPSRAPTTS